MNKDLYDNIYTVPDYLLKVLYNNITKYPKDTKGYQRVNNIVNNPEITYSNVKRILSFLENYNPIKNNKEEFDIIGGHKMRNWCKSVLNSDRKTSKNTKKAHSELTTKDNVYRKAHDKDFTHNSKLDTYKSELTEGKKYINKKTLTMLIENIIEGSIKLENEASIGIIFNTDSKFLVLKRSETDDWMPNKWSLPGGNIEKGETPEIAFMREVKEESGLNITKAKHLFNKLENNYNIYFMASFLENNDSVKISFEHNDFKWVRLSEVKNMDCVPNLFNDIVSSFLNV